MRYRKALEKLAELYTQRNFFNRVQKYSILKCLKKSGLTRDTALELGFGMTNHKWSKCLNFPLSNFINANKHWDFVLYRAILN